MNLVSYNGALYRMEDDRSKTSVIPDESELTAAEAIRMQAEMCDSTPCNKCKLNRDKQGCISYRRKHPDEAVKAIEEYLYKKTLRKDFELAAQICEELGCPSAAAELRKMVRDE